MIHFHTAYQTPNTKLHPMHTTIPRISRENADFPISLSYNRSIAQCTMYTPINLYIQVIDNKNKPIHPPTIPSPHFPYPCHLLQPPNLQTRPLIININFLFNPNPNSGIPSLGLLIPPLPLHGQIAYMHVSDMYTFGLFENLLREHGGVENMFSGCGT